ncbi:SWI/SNF complex subunit SWI3A-like isoform X1 [Papaver somniferum]|uniref:SWI/SNF complex subunit SWI3A-like isoform X1 n=1 Tax=Papaver somniferum TaxID=3469 RepID=UPI000E7013E4|nr:SWI/SNF complex subunit SWI3A-like isoform X1 [Papaver somniferum]
MEINNDEENSKPLPANEPEQQELYSIPIYSSWFSWDEIHEIETTFLKEFFNGTSISRTPKVYKDYRDFIINKYREDPSRRLTFTEIRKSLIGDVSLLHKVFLFLEKWGLINFSVITSSSPDGGQNTLAIVKDGVDEKIKVKFEEGAPNGVRVVAEPGSVKAVALPKTLNEDVEKGGENGFTVPPLASYNDVFGDLERKEVVCGTCGEDCGSGYYVSDKQKGQVLCVKCFKVYCESKPVEDFNFHDSKESVNNSGTDAWTEAETLLLLESVMKHGDDWDLVAQDVQTKNKLECISRIIELPFGELVLGMTNGKGDEKNTTDANNVKSHEPSSVGLQEIAKETIEKENHYQEPTKETVQTAEVEIEEPPSKRRCIAPFADSGSSLMKQIAKLSTGMGTRIGAAAAEAAIAAICDENPYARVMFEGQAEADTLYPILRHEDEGAPVVEDLKTGEGVPMVEDLKTGEGVPIVEDMKTGEKPSELETQEATSDHVPIKLRIRAAMATALGTAAAHSKRLADQEDREIEQLVATIIETQLRKTSLKVKHLEDLELIMEKEYAYIQEQKESIITDWVDVLQGVFRAGIPRWRDRSSVRSFANNVV